MRAGQGTNLERTSDVLIAGGGFAGLALAIALRQALGPSFSRDGRRPDARARAVPSDERASAIVAAARRLFETLGVWQAVADDAQPILDMVVTDSRLDDAVRPAFLTFAGEIEPDEPFAHMIENRRLIAALEAKAKETGVECRRRRRVLPADEGKGLPRGSLTASRRTRSVTLCAARQCRAATATHRGAAPGRRRRCAFVDPRRRRHRHARLELRPVGDRHHCRARTRPWRTRRRAFSAGRAVRDPAAQGAALVDRMDGNGA